MSTKACVCVVAVLGSSDFGGSSAAVRHSVAVRHSAALRHWFWNFKNEAEMNFSLVIEVGSLRIARMDLSRRDDLKNKDKQQQQQ